MASYVVVGKSERIVTAVLQGVRSFTDAKCVVIGNHETRNLRWSSLCAHHSCADFDGDDDARVASIINALHVRTPEITVIPADCEGVRLLNRVRAQLRARVIPMPDRATLELMDNKWRFYAFCRTAGLDVPTTFFVGRKENIDFDAVVATLGLPFVLKPANESGSLGVQVIASEAQYAKAVLQNADYQFRTLIVQRHIEGEDIDISLLSLHGRLAAFAIQQVRGATIAFVPNTALERMAARLCKASAYHGVMHIDARIERSTGTVYLIESNPRFWASLTAAIWCGLNFVAESTNEAAHTNEVRRLTEGHAYTRHPLLRPSSWPSLLHDPGQQGRLSRSAVLDMYLLGRFTGDLPLMAARYVGKRAARSLQTIRKT
jgi:predicted ATP-grasp superfamily ATP-dependent carboligase